eukprot:Rhum_TRINITY_DN15814_c0_g1::Rhum_TRINITY_DN15814_c0_g1_i1::g.162183::m.162183
MRRTANLLQAAQAATKSQFMTLNADDVLVRRGVHTPKPRATLLEGQVLSVRRVGEEFQSMAGTAVRYDVVVARTSDQSALTCSLVLPVVETTRTPPACNDYISALINPAKHNAIATWSYLANEKVLASASMAAVKTDIIAAISQSYLAGNTSVKERLELTTWSLDWVQQSSR